MLGLIAVAVCACKEVQLAGPVVKADVYIDLLNQPGASFQKLKTTDKFDVIQEFGLATWSTMPDWEKFARVGNFEVDEDLVDPDSLYLVAARFGEDVDADRNGKYDNFPREIEGEWHAIMTGEALLANATYVSALTEAAYQYVRSDIGLVDDTELLERLDEFARLVVQDVDRSGEVDYMDVLRWTRLYSEKKYLGDIALLDNLAEVITTDQQDYIRYAAAASVWRNEVVQPVRPDDVEGTNVGGSVDGNVTWTREFSPYDVTADMDIDGDLTIEAGVEIRANGRLITINGDLFIEGVPRQPAVLDDVVFIIYNWGESAASRIRYASFHKGRMTARIQRFTMEQSRAEEWQFEIRTIVNTADSWATIRQNIFEKSRVVFYNRLPPRNLFMVDFTNNLFVPSGSSNSEIITKWEAPVGNLTVENNSFNPDMRILRSGTDPVLNVRNNYWGVQSSSEIDFDMVIPDNGGESPYQFIYYLPRLTSPHPDTPVEP